MPAFDKLCSWVWVLLIAAIPFALAYAVRLLRFLIKRIRLAVYLRRIGARALRPLPWLIPWRTACDYLLDLRDPATGQITHTLAIQLIPTIRGGTEYCVGDMENWQCKHHFGMPMSQGILMMDFGYRRLRRRPADRIFRMAPPGAVRVYLFHPHPFALTPALRGRGKHNRFNRGDTLPVPLWREGILLLDLATLRLLQSRDLSQRAALLDRLNQSKKSTPPSDRTAGCRLCRH